MSTIARTRTAVRIPKASAWLPLVALPIAVCLLGSALPRWVFMWALALAIFAGLKWLTLAECADTAKAPALRRWGYLLFWPGMDAGRFLSETRTIPMPHWRDWGLAAGNTLCGVLLLVRGVPIIAGRSPWLAGWVGMVGIALVLHFGLLHVLSLCWRRAGVHAPPIMNCPIRAASLSEFWGRRWNLAFRDAAHHFVFRPLVGRWGVAAATTAVFLVSGLVHDLVISSAAGAGFGLPTMYFLLQALGLFAERSSIGKRIGLGRGILGWLFCGIVIVAPVGLLFHGPFVERVVIPMLEALRFM